MPVPEADVIRNLPVLRWQGMAAHCESAPLEGAHDQAERRVPYRDAAGHDHTGRAPYKVRAKLWFLQSLGSFEELPQWLTSLEDGSSGDLEHPIRGKIRARVLTWSVDLTAQNRGGVSIDIEWVETVDDYDDIKALGTVAIDPAAAAAAADAACEELGIEYPDGQPETSLTEAYGALKGGVLSAGLSLTGKLNQISGVVTGLIEDVESLNDVASWPATANLLSFFSALEDLKKKIEKASARPTAKITTTSATTLTTVASDLGADINDLISLNLGLLRSPVIPAGAIVTYYTK